MLTSYRRRLEDGRKCTFNHSYRQEQLNAKVESIVLDMVKHKRFYEFITQKMDEKIDVSNLETERSNFREQLRRVEGAKKLSEQMNKLDVTDRHYNRKYQDMQDRLGTLYDRINKTEDAIAEVSSKINGAFSEQVCSEYLYKILLYFNLMRYIMSDSNKKKFFQYFVKSIEIYPDADSNNRILKHIDFRFHVSYDVEGTEFC